MNIAHQQKTGEIGHHTGMIPSQPETDTGDRDQTTERGSGPSRGRKRALDALEPSQSFWANGVDLEPKVDEPLAALSRLGSNGRKNITTQSTPRHLSAVQ